MLQVYVFDKIQANLYLYMMTSSNGSMFRVTGLLCGEFTGHRWIPLTKASDAEFWESELVYPNKNGV